MTGLIDPLDTGDSQPEAGEDGTAAAPDGELARVRALVLQAHPEVVPELVRGASIAELLASIEPAREAYAGIAARLAAGRVPPAPVPAGGAPAVIDIERLPTIEKVRRGLAGRARSHTR